MEKHCPRAFDAAAAYVVRTGLFMKQSLPELHRAFAELAAIRPAAFLEIGCLEGGSLYIYAHACLPPALIVAVDSGKDGADHFRTLGRTCGALRAKGFCVALIRGRSQDPAVLTRVRGALDGRRLDAAHIDGGHSLGEFLADVENARSLIKPGGLILAHDVKGSARSQVRQGWDQLCADGAGGAVLRGNRPDKYRAGIGVIRV